MTSVFTVGPDRPTLDFFGHVTVNTHVYIFCWPNIFYHRAIYFLSDSKEGQTAHVILQDDRRPPTVLGVEDLLEGIDSRRCGLSFTGSSGGFSPLL
jgi:hypothetical protein